MFNLPLPFDKKALKINFERLLENNYKNFDFQNSKSLLDSIFGNSPYLSDIIIEFSEFFCDLLEKGIDENFNQQIKLISELNIKNPDLDKEKLCKELRIAKRKVALLTAISEITGEKAGAEAMEKLSLFADTCVIATCKFLFKKYAAQKIIELADDNDPFKRSGLLIIAIGKLGSYELNYSSDIDLAVFFEDEKIKYLGRKTIQQFYIEFAQELTDILSRRTADGYVFRVDMRLRPDPASNPLAVSLEKAEKYYFTVGQNWERAAMIKARAICGDTYASEAFFAFMNRNVWRKSLDFETIEDIHSIKRQIDTRQGMHPENLYGYNIKLGRGGIREIEFYVQTQQLIWGGRKTNLQVKKTIDALYELAKEGEISKQTADELADAYIFYRMVEHRLQMVNDEQTHTLPQDRNKMEAIACFCGFDDEKEFVNELLLKIETVRNHYSKLFETSPSLASDLPHVVGSLIFTGTENHPDTLETLSKMGFNAPDKVSDIVRGWHHGRYNCTRKKRSRAVLTKLMPTIFSIFSKSPDPDISFIRFDEFLSRLPEGSQIFSMLYVNPGILELMAKVMGGYPEIAENLCKNTALLEYVLAPEFYDTLPDLSDLEESLERSVSKSEKNLDDIFDAVKDWANDRKFRVGIQFIRGELSSDEVFLSLSNIAEAVIKTLIKELNKDFEKNHGKIKNGNFAVLALGKFGSRELTFKSDLDLVFIYDFAETDINEDITPSAYYTRFANKLVYALSSITGTGRLYEVDLRLRPLGDSGSIATSLKSFDEYYSPGKKDGYAWVWEYMTLTRARAISADDKFSKKLDELILKKLLHKWDEKTLYKEAEYIYKKFREHRNSKKIGDFDVKNSLGGIFDLEFLLRFLQLKFLPDNPGIYERSSKKSIELLGAKKLIPQEDAAQLKVAFEALTNVQNILRITAEDKVTPYTEEILCKIVSCNSASEMYKKLEFKMSNVKNLFKKYMGF